MREDRPPHLEIVPEPGGSVRAPTEGARTLSLQPAGNQLSDVLSEFARTMLTDFPIQGILDHLVLRIVDVLPITSAGVTLISDGASPRYIAASDSSALRFEQLQTDLAEGPCLAAYESGEAVSVPDVRSDLRFPKFCPAALASGLGAVFTFPLRHEDHQLGALDVYRDRPGPLNAEHMSSAQTLADVVAAYILNAQIRSDLQANSDRILDDSLHDPLTGLANRQLLFERIDESLTQPRKANRAMAIFFVDVDNLKATNDERGHQIGDELLVAVGGRLSGLLRSGDTLARLAGDEFVILFGDLERFEEVSAVADRVLSALCGTFSLSDGDVKSTSSIGVATLDRPGMQRKELMANADKAMYAAKRAGGARVEVFRCQPVSLSAD
jgi:diguanylate cyclase (GGDEF)-like protein